MTGCSTCMGDVGAARSVHLQNFATCQHNRALYGGGARLADMMPVDGDLPADIDVRGQRGRTSR
jgi:hypothetical protein